MTWLLKKKKPKAKLELPPSPHRFGIDEMPAPKAEAQPGSGKYIMDIPDKFHEIKFPEEDIPEKEEKPVQLEKLYFEPEPKKSEMPDIPERLDIPEMPELPEIPELKSKIAESINPIMPQGPVFIKSNDFQDVLTKIEDIKQNVHQTEEIFKRLNEIKNEKDEAFGQWKESLEDVQRKLLYIEKSLYEV